MGNGPSQPNKVVENPIHEQERVATPMEPKLTAEQGLHL